MKREKQLVAVVVGTIEHGDSVDMLVRMLEQAQHRIAAETLDDARVDIDQVTTGGYYPTTSTVVQILAWRDETDEEFAIRRGNIKMSEERQREHELAEYRRLRAKFEKE